MAAHACFHAPGRVRHVDHLIFLFFLCTLVPPGLAGVGNQPSVSAAVTRFTADAEQALLLCEGIGMFSNQGVGMAGQAARILVGSHFSAQTFGNLFRPIIEKDPISIGVRILSPARVFVLQTLGHIVRVTHRFGQYLMHDPNGLGERFLHGAGRSVNPNDQQDAHEMAMAEGMSQRQRFPAHMHQAWKKA